MVIFSVFKRGYCERTSTVVDQLGIVFDLNSKTYHAEADRSGKLLYVESADSKVMSASWTDAVNARFSKQLEEAARTHKR